MEIEFGWIGWNQTEGSDKIWGYLLADRSASNHARMVHVFWGRRGKTLSFKTQPYDRQLLNLMDSKNRKGYMGINSDEFLEMWPDFHEMCEQRLTWHLMAQDQ